MKTISYRHVDVFSNKPFSGNGLVVCVNQSLSTEEMQSLAEEMRQYESIFLHSTSDPRRFSARIFTMEEELDFAGHPILGAACVLHELFAPNISYSDWFLDLAHKQVSISTNKNDSGYYAVMDQGIPDFHAPLDPELSLSITQALNLTEEDLYPELPLQIISTGLPNLIVPIRSELDKVRLSSDFEKLLSLTKAKFAYILDVDKCEGRTWDNGGRVEDVATGSAAGPVGAFLVKYGIIPANKDFILNQGRFLGRPSQIGVKVEGEKDQITSIKVGGNVCMIAKGVFDPF